MWYNMYKAFVDFINIEIRSIRFLKKILEVQLEFYFDVKSEKRFILLMILLTVRWLYIV